MNSLSFSLAPIKRSPYGGGVKRMVLIIGVLAAVGLVSCGKKEERVQISEVRSNLGELDEEGFFVRVPDHWMRTGAEIPGARFRDRLLNYQFREKGEIYLTNNLKGDILEHANRWLGQFQNEPKKSLAEFETLSFGGQKGILVTCEGVFQGKNKEWALKGLLVEGVEGQVISVKMLGPKEEVLQEDKGFRQFCESFTVREVKEENEERGAK